jgi:hypothetical protein
MDSSSGYGGWPSAQQQHFNSTGPAQHASLSSHQSTRTNMPYSSSGQFGYQTPPPAAAGAAGFNYGFGQAQPTPAGPSSNMTSQSHHYQPQQQQQSLHAHSFPGAEADSLKSVKDLPAAFQPIFNFRCGCPTHMQFPAQPGTRVLTLHACAWPTGTSTQCSPSALMSPVHQTSTW